MLSFCKLSLSFLVIFYVDPICICPVFFFASPTHRATRIVQPQASRRPSVGPDRSSAPGPEAQPSQGPPAASQAASAHPRPRADRGRILRGPQESSLRPQPRILQDQATSKGNF